MNNINIDDLYKLKSLSNIQLNDDGTYSCFIVHSVNKGNDEYNSNIWGYNLESKEYKQLTNFKYIKDFIWIKKDTVLIVVSNEAKKDEMICYQLNINTQKMDELFKINKDIHSIKMINDKQFAFISPETLSKSEDNDMYIELNEIPFWSNGLGYTNERRSGIYIYDTGSNECIKITDDYMSVENYNVSTDGGSIVYIGKEYKDIKPLENKIYIYNINNKETKLVTNNKFLYSFVDFINENQIIACGSDMKEYGENENHNIYIIDLNEEIKMTLNKSINRSLWNTVCTDCKIGSSPLIKLYNENLYFTISEGGNVYLAKIDLQGSLDKIIDKDGTIDSYDIKNDKLIFIGLRENRPQELYEKNQDELKITEFNGWISNKKLSKYENIIVDTELNMEIEGWIVKPDIFDGKKKYPTILSIHGGPKMAFGEVFFHEVECLSSEGYIVIFCNPRGSNGKDDEFADIRGKFGTIDYDDIMRFMEYVIDKYDYVDSERLGVMGGSYGGFMTNWIIGHTDKFKVAISERGISNWVTMFTMSDIGYTWTEYQNKANPWSDIDKLWNHSPLKYANKVKTPTLIIHSEDDYRCTLSESLQMYTSLKYHGVDSKLCIFKRENHDLNRTGRPSNRVNRLNEIKNWLNKYLKS